jgi:glycerol-3-phosphate acyltransferase PlsY
VADNAVVSRYSSLAALVAALFRAVGRVVSPGRGPVFGAVVVMSVILVARHRTNIVKLARGEESRIGQKKATQD